MKYGNIKSETNKNYNNTSDQRLPCLSNISSISIVVITQSTSLEEIITILFPEPYVNL
jgi:hypothetical protein